MTTTLLATIPSPPQGVWYLPIRAYALCIVTGIIAAIFLTRARYAARGGNPEVVMDAAVISVILGIIGGRLYHVITDHDSYFCRGCDPVDAFKVANGGLGIMGAVALGTLGVWIMMRRKGLPFAPLADAAAPGIILAQAIGRLGNWFNQELYGRPTDVPWGLKIYRRVDESGAVAPLNGRSTGEVLTVVHPTFLYEMLWNLGVVVLLLWADRRFRMGHGRVFALYVAAYGAGRFWVELMRSDPATHILGLRVNTVTSTLLFLGGVALLFLLRGRRETPEEVNPHAPRPGSAVVEPGGNAVRVSGDAEMTTPVTGADTSRSRPRDDGGVAGR
ncbi:prolipoprotein diacylglyceryl transferase [Corynebacterium pygosceleis]|uniref:Phosphatidylglycerol--prolipoprotein diacylglyceryl transferase n=1 Tax=Corynebacterium pygosceleis TaxID=2800406 RepID=A0A9Q4C8A0_9CORY|nr:prolipoprotein diacylglyceryl transferase [Corynebacterium pygosceleis]MCK7636700.1 prolipoprotein diacylglyceryl transferase [Corynebacterium pygosceleis]MCK7674187.1 prolipoprotein diacylglyceryl transferase [Corynebacterium pygosceleis]MCL0120511.1 prolipoprotein diacylglyceryl transferase [Corynebacterium pygosceleis]MCX7467453.1 prolipoprotein diacylglyceryl transferase [Corynebacterium pygosceleis]